MIHWLQNCKHYHCSISLLRFYLSLCVWICAVLFLVRKHSSGLIIVSCFVKLSYAHTQYCVVETTTQERHTTICLPYFNMVLLFSNNVMIVWLLENNVITVLVQLFFSLSLHHIVDLIGPLSSLVFNINTVKLYPSLRAIYN